MGDRPRRSRCAAPANGGGRRRGDATAARRRKCAKAIRRPGRAHEQRLKAAWRVREGSRTACSLIPATPRPRKARRVHESAEGAAGRRAKRPQRSPGVRRAAVAARSRRAAGSASSAKRAQCAVRGVATLATVPTSPIFVRRQHQVRGAPWRRGAAAAAVVSAVSISKPISDARTGANGGGSRSPPIAEALAMRCRVQKAEPNSWRVARSRDACGAAVFTASRRSRRSVVFHQGCAVHQSLGEFRSSKPASRRPSRSLRREPTSRRP